MNDQLPAEVDQEIDHAQMEAECRKMCNKLVTVVQQYSADRTRLRNLVLFEDRAYGTKTRERSAVLAHDRPEVELILYHREHVLRLERLTTTAQVAYDRMVARGDDNDAKTLIVALQEMNRLEEKRLKHLQMLEDILADYSKELTSKESLAAKVVSDTAGLTQRMAEHRDKMSLANKHAQIPSNAELKERLALKYGVPVEQVDAILAAKTVEAETIDG